MSEFKGTKGRWNHIKSYDHHIEVDGKILVTIHCHEGGKPKYDGRLISKAPEMLDLLNHFVNADPSDGTWNYQACMDKARQLIKEATTI